jgi:hypothetical protein
VTKFCPQNFTEFRTHSQKGVSWAKARRFELTFPKGFGFPRFGKEEEVSCAGAKVEHQIGLGKAEAQNPIESSLLEG